MIDEAVLQIRKPRRERAEMRFLTWPHVMDLELLRFASGASTSTISSCGWPPGPEKGR